MPVPDPPYSPTFQNLTNVAVSVFFADGDDNGSAIDTRQIGWGTSPSAPQHWITSDRSSTVSGLTSGTLYYFWAKTHNSQGWSALSGKRTLVTKDVPDAPHAVTYSAVTQNSIRIVSADPANDGGDTILERQFAYGTSATAPQVFLSTPGGLAQPTNLSAGAKYYFWARVRNYYGWSAYSPIVSATLVAGAWLKVGTVWKRAVPYVNVNGVWKVAYPWGKVAGFWAEAEKN